MLINSQKRGGLFEENLVFLHKNIYYEIAMTTVVVNTNENLAIPYSIKNKYYLNMKLLLEKSLRKHTSK
jgi:hypothetical protein